MEFRHGRNEAAMIWHTVMIRFREDVTDEQRDDCEARLNAWFGSNPDISFYRVARSVGEDRSTLVLAGLPDREALDRYYNDAVHIETKMLVQSLREPGLNFLDVETEDPVDALARSLM
jgi:hypothetical protein